MFEFYTTQTFSLGKFVSINLIFIVGWLIPLVFVLSDIFLKHGTRNRSFYSNWGSYELPKSVRNISQYFIGILIVPIFLSFLDTIVVVVTEDSIVDKLVHVFIFFVVSIFFGLSMLSGSARTARELAWGFVVYLGAYMLYAIQVYFLSHYVAGFYFSVFLASTAFVLASGFNFKTVSMAVVFIIGSLVVMDSVKMI